MDRFDFMNIVTDIFQECKTAEQISDRALTMIQDIAQISTNSKIYLGAGILNLAKEDK